MKQSSNQNFSLKGLVNILYVYGMFFFSMLFSLPLLAATFNVTTTVDGGPGSLRQAIADAEALGGSNTIIVPAGTYNLTQGQIIFGNVPQSLTIIGASPASTIINMTTTNQNRIFFINTSGTVANVLTSISGITFTNGHLTEAFGGGAILAGGPGNALTLTDCIFQNNSIDAVTGGTTGGAINMSGGGALNINHCIFNNNSNPKADGGAVNYFLPNFSGLTGSITITNSTFFNNLVSAGNGSGGAAIAIQTQGKIAGTTNTFSATITNNTFTNNQATGTGAVGGAIKTSHGFEAGNTIQVHYNRFDGNTSTIAPNALAMGEAAGSVDASNNWWGCNTDPSTVVTSCNNAAKTGGTGGGTLTTSPWLQLKATASPASICPTATSTVTASFLSNSANTAIAASNLTVLQGLPISFSATLGSLSGAQTSIQSTGTATVTYTAGSTPGNGSVNAVVDHVPSNDPTAKASITILTPASIVTQPVSTLACTGSNPTLSVVAAGSPTISYQWRKGTTPLTNGSDFSGVDTHILTILNAGPEDEATNYNVVVSNTCATVPSNEVSLTVYDPPVVNTPTITQPTCAIPSGTIVVNATGPVGATIEYSSDGSTFQPSNSFALLTPGNYTIKVRIQGLNDCFTAYINNPVVIDPVPTPPTMSAPTVTQPNCATTTGSIVVNATGASTLQYKINDGGWGSSNTFSTLAPGVYTVYARLQNQTTCESNYGPITIDPVPNPPSVGEPTVDQPTCTITHGKIVVSATGDGTLEYRLNDLAWQSSEVFDNLAPGDYNISVRLVDQPTCLSNYSGNPVTINEIPVTPSNAPVISGSICQDATTIQGTSSEADGTIITVLKNGSVTIGTSTVSSHSWNASISAVSVGDQITAFATAPGKCISGASNIITVIISNPTTTVLTSNIGQAFTTAPNNDITFTATVTSAGSPVTTGTVTFSEGATILGSSNLNSSGQASLNVSFTSEGSHIIKATFNGVCPYSGSNGTMSQLVDNHTSITGNNFCNDRSPITINDMAPASPYASHIFVSGLTGPITNIKVKINGFNHTKPDNVDMLLVAPNGANLIIWSDAGGAIPAFNSNIILDDAAPALIPPAGIIPGVYKPTDYDFGDIFPAPAISPMAFAPPAGTGTLASIFNGINPNGVWSLYVFDDEPGNVGNIQSWCLEITSDVPPVITCPAAITVNNDAGLCSASVALTGTNAATASGIPAPDITYKINDAVITSPYVFPVGTTTVTAIATNRAGTDDCSFTVTVNDNEPPVITGFDESTISVWPPNHKMVPVATYISTDNCGGASTCVVDVTSSDPDNGTGDGDTSPDWDVVGNTIRVRAEKGNGKEVRVYDITLTCTDAAGHSTVKHKQVRIAHNITSPVTGTSFKVGSTVAFTGSFWDKPVNKHTAQWLLDDATTVKASVTEPSGLKNGKITGSYKFSNAGVYRLQMNITDQNKVTSSVNTNDDMEEIIVIYDPNGGYTYGGGWFNSPAGALTSNPTAKGKVNFGFTVNYYKGATLPKGETQFELKVGDLQFNALNFEYLSISGYKAVFKGTGKIVGGQSGINFMMYVTDGALDGTGIDKVRIKIFNKNTGLVYYDSQPGASDAANPTTAVGVNSQVVIGGINNTLTKLSASQQGMVAESGPQLDVSAMPNPSQDNFTIQLKGINKKDVITVQVFDQYGRLVETKKTYSGSTLTIGERYRPGVYYLRATQSNSHTEIKLIRMAN
jgi:hypothetical protein